MLKSLKVENFKGIESNILPELGKITVICGKNNSGKSSVLEGIVNKESRSLGIELNDELHEEIRELFLSQANRYSTPHPSHSIKWFYGFLENFIASNRIWYESDKQNFINSAQSSQKDDHQIGRHEKSIFKYDHIFDKAFTNLKYPDDSLLLISPKRRCPTQCKIQLNKQIKGNGEGVVNKLFYLKNQDLDSSDFKIYQDILSLFKAITKCSFNITPTEENEIELKFLVNSKWKSADNCGMGLKDVLVLLTVIYSTNAKVYLIEEPENHLHADFQNKLLNNLAESNGKQFIISTHSNEIINHRAVNQLYFTWYDGQVHISNKTSISKIIDSLGHSIIENISSDLIILVEGPTDIPVFKHVLEIFDISNLANIKFWPLGGDIMGSLDLSIFKGFNKVMAIVDTDPGSAKIRNTFKKNCKTHNIAFFKLKRYSIENYFPLNIIRKVFPNQVPKSINILNPDLPVDEQIGFKKKGKSIKGKNHILAKELSIEQIEETDLIDFVNEVKQYLENET